MDKSLYAASVLVLVALAVGSTISTGQSSSSPNALPYASSNPFAGAYHSPFELHSLWNQQQQHFVNRYGRPPSSLHPTDLRSLVNTLQRKAISTLEASSAAEPSLLPSSLNVSETCHAPFQQLVPKQCTVSARSIISTDAVMWIGSDATVYYHDSTKGIVAVSKLGIPSYYYRGAPACSAVGAAGCFFLTANSTSFIVTGYAWGKGAVQTFNADISSYIACPEGPSSQCNIRLFSLTSDGDYGILVATNVTMAVIVNASTSQILSSFSLPPPSPEGIFAQVTAARATYVFYTITITITAVNIMTGQALWQRNISNPYYITAFTHDYLYVIMDGPQPLAGVSVMVLNDNTGDVVYNTSSLAQCNYIYMTTISCNLICQSYTQGTLSVVDVTVNPPAISTFFTAPPNCSFYITYVDANNLALVTTSAFVPTDQYIGSLNVVDFSAANKTVWSINIQGPGNPAGYYVSATVMDDRIVAAIYNFTSGDHGGSLYFLGEKSGVPCPPVLQL